MIEKNIAPRTDRFPLYVLPAYSRLENHLSCQQITNRIIVNLRPKKAVNQEFLADFVCDFKRVEF